MRKLPVDRYVVYYLTDEETYRAIVVRIVYSGRNIADIAKETDGEDFR